MTLKFIQIFYDDKQKTACYNFSQLYKNDTLTPYFENSVIADLVPKIEADYIGICSWRLSEKRYSGYTPIMLNGSIDLREDKIQSAILNEHPDVINLRPFSPSHQMLDNARMWHGGQIHDYSWDNAIEELRKFIHVPDEVKTPIYENAFIAKRSLYVDYVTDCLIPVMDFMRDKPVFFTDSGYARKKERDNPSAVKEYREKTGRNDYPIAPFILERLFSIWINDKQLKIINL